MKHQISSLEISLLAKASDKIKPNIQTKIFKIELVSSQEQTATIF